MNMFDFLHKLRISFWELPMRRKIIVFALLAVALIIFLLLFLIASQRSIVWEFPKTAPLPTAYPATQSSKTWEIILAYNTKKKTLSLEKVTLLSKSIRPDYNRGSPLSPYKLTVSDSNNNVLYQTRVHVTEQLLYSILPGSVGKGGRIPPSPSLLKTTLFIPYIPGNTGIQISKNNVVVLTISLPKQISLRIGTKAYAQEPGGSCEPLKVAFLGDGYTDENEYRKDVSFIQNGFKEVEPFKSVSGNLFSFFRIDSSELLGCASSLQKCDLQKVEEIGHRMLPDASKFIVLVNNPNAEAVDGDTVGFANGLGGDIAVVVNRFRVHDETKGSILLRQVAIHEFLGHAVGFLYDRYVSKDETSGSLVAGVQSNCSDKAEGEAFWKMAGTQGGFKGCMNNNFFAPAKPTCPETEKFLSTGVPTSIMSTLGCSVGYTFDATEQYWITKEILPRLRSCPLSPTPEITPGGLTPTPPSSSCAGFSEKECKLVEETPVQVGDRTEKNRRYECTSGDKTFVCVWTTESDKQSVCSFGSDGYNCFMYCNDLTEKFGGSSVAAKAKFKKECFEEHCVNVNTSCPSTAETCETNSCPAPAACNKEHTCVTQVTPTPVPASGSSSPVYVCEEVGIPSDNKKLQIQPLRCRPK